jgi:hypothetical protein
MTTRLDWDSQNRLEFREKSADKEHGESDISIEKPGRKKT